LQIDLHITNSNGSEFSSEETGIIYMVLILSVAITMIFSFYLGKIKQDFKKNEELDWALAILIMVIGFEMLHNYLLLWHMTIYAYDG